MINIQFTKVNPFLDNTTSPIDMDTTKVSVRKDTKTYVQRTF